MGITVNSGYNILDTIKNVYLKEVQNDDLDNTLNTLINFACSDIEDFCKQPIIQITGLDITEYTKIYKYDSYFFGKREQEIKDVILPFTGVIPVVVNTVSYFNKYDYTSGTIPQGYSQNNFYYLFENMLHTLHFIPFLKPEYVLTINVDVGFTIANIPNQLLEAACRLVMWKFYETEQGKGLLNIKTQQEQFNGMMQRNTTYGDLWSDICTQNLSMYVRVPQ